MCCVKMKRAGNALCRYEHEQHGHFCIKTASSSIENRFHLLFSMATDRQKAYFKTVSTSTGTTGPGTPVPCHQNYEHGYEHG